MLYKERLHSRRDIFQDAVLAAHDITGDSVFSLARQLAETPAPTGSMARALGDTIATYVQRLQQQEQLPLTLMLDFDGTRNIAVSVGDAITSNPVLVTAHGDEISYWAAPTPGGTRIHAIPLHTERLFPKGDVPPGTVVTMDAIVLRSSETAGMSFDVVSDGVIKRVAGGSPYPVFEPVDAQADIRVGDRIVFDPRPHRLDREGDKLRGIIDNRAGVAVILSALRSFATLAQDHNDLGALFVITDGEEGESNPPVFSTGAQALFEALKRYDPTYRHSKCLNVDGHEYDDDNDPFQVGPLVGGIISDGKGLAMPLETVMKMRLFSDYVSSVGGGVARFASDITDDCGRHIKISTSRSDEEGFRRAGKPYYDIYPIGYGIKRSHHRGGDASEAWLPDLVATARWLVPAIVAANYDLL